MVLVRLSFSYPVKGWVQPDLMTVVSRVLLLDILIILYCYVSLISENKYDDDDGMESFLRVTAVVAGTAETAY